MAKVVPIKKGFENPRALLAHVMEDEDIERLIVFTLSKDDVLSSAQFNMTYEKIAWIAVHCLKYVGEQDG